MKKHSLTKRLILHVVLITGCVIFSFPFVWLLSTSFKESEEIFVFPPKWIPKTPPRVTVSPYVADDEYEEMKKPEAMRENDWDRLRPAISDALWKVGQEYLRGVGRKGLTGLRESLVSGLWEEAYKSIPDEIWTGSADIASGDAAHSASSWESRKATIVAEVAKRVDGDVFEKVWDNIYRSFSIRDPFIKDIALNRLTLKESGDYLDRWKALDGSFVSLLKKAKADRTSDGQDSGPADGGAGKAKGHLEISYDFSSVDQVALQAVLPLPTDPEGFLALTLPVRADKSWHYLDCEIELAGKSFKSSEPFLLGNDLWQEATWQLPIEEEKVWEVRDYIPLSKEADVSDFREDGAFRLTLTLRRSSHLTAIYHKYERNYSEALRFIPFWRYTANSVFLVIMNVVGQIFACSFVAYSFARLNWPGRDACFVVLLGTMMLPPQVTMIPVFLIMKGLGWFNTLKPMWAPAFFGSAFFIFLLRQFMKTIPTDLEDAAKIDGCGYFGIYWRIILPLIKPSLAAIAIFTFMGAWNDFMGPLIYVNDQRLYPLSLGLFTFQTTHGGEYGMMMAASTLMTLPVIIIFFFAQKYFIQGVTLTGMKG